MRNTLDPLAYSRSLRQPRFGPPPKLLLCHSRYQQVSTYLHTPGVVLLAE